MSNGGGAACIWTLCPGSKVTESSGCLDALSPDSGGTDGEHRLEGPGRPMHSSASASCEGGTAIFFFPVVLVAIPFDTCETVTVPQLGIFDAL